MSYSFNVRAATLAIAGAALAAKLDEVEAQQPIHARDRGLAYETAMSMLGQCAAPEEDQEFSISVAGHCACPLNAPFTSMGLNVSIAVLSKTT